MNKKIVISLLFTLPAIVLAGHGEAGTSQYFNQTGREYDIVPRMVDFSLFAGLMIYLLASPIKQFFANRRDSVATQLNEIESRLQDAKNAQKDAQTALVQSEVQAKEIIDDAKKEAELIAKKAEKELESDVALLQTQHNDKIEFEERRMAKETIDSILADNISSEDIPLSENKVVEILAKKVA